MAIARNARKSARPSRKVNENRQPPMDTTVVVDKAYRFTGPESYHSIIGQVMAYMGYVGGHEDSQVAARVGLDDSDGRIRLWCDFFSAGRTFHSEAVLCRQGHWAEDAKLCLLHWHARHTGEEPSNWGTLTGVRPTKLVHHLFDQGLDPSQAAARLHSRYHVAPDLAGRLIQLAQTQRPYVTGQEGRAALYVGLPYCSSHCLYCSFPSRLIGRESPAVLQDLARAMIADIEGAAALCGDAGLQVCTAYVGGGTPTCLPLDFLEPVMTALAKAFPKLSEWTVEAGRPDTATADKLALLRSLGVDRISVNPQTMQQRLLDLLGRKHLVHQIYDMFDQCRQLAFPVINMDFIAGLPGQTLADMQENMEIVCQLVPENVTIHTLALKKNAPLYGHVLRQAIPAAQTVSQMLDCCRQALSGRGYFPYYMYRQKYMAANFANVGYALGDHIGKYNIQMMEERQTVIAVGPGGATKFLAAPGQPMEKLYMPKDVGTYVQNVRPLLKERRRLCRIIYGGDD